MSATSDKITAALKGKTTGLTSKELREATGLEGSLFSATLSLMVGRSDLTKHAGKTRNDSRYSLNPEKLADAPRSTKRKSKKKKPRRAAPPQRRGGKARRTPAPLERTFIPAITADQELVLVDRGADPGVRIFSAEDTQAVAQLMLSNFSV